MCFAPRLCAGAVRPPFHFLGWRASPFPRTPRPLSWEWACIPPPPFTVQDQTLPCLALPSASLAPPPALSVGYFYPLLAGRCFWGDSGEETPKPLSSHCAPRSSTLLRGSGREEWPRNWGWSVRAPPPAVRALGTRHHRLGCAARPGSRSGEEPLASRRLPWQAFMAAARAHA